MGRNPKSFTETGVAGGRDYRQGLRYDDLTVELRGQWGIRKFREMRDNDPTVGSILAGIEMLARGANWTFKPAKVSASGDASPDKSEISDDIAPVAVSKPKDENVKFVEDVMNDMDFTFEEFISDAMTMLPYGFSLFEMVFKRREDGKIGIKKLGPRAQWTIESFDVDPTGVMLGAWQQTWNGGRVYIPASRLLNFRTTSSNCDPAGRSILRNAYRSYVYVTHIQEYEAVAIERELNGLPVGRVPSEYLWPTATDAQKAFVEKFKAILRDVKKNEQGYVLLPSDLWETEDGKFADKYMVEFELLASKGTRDIDTRKVVAGHQQDIARTVLADFMMLGGGERGSFAMSKSKSDIFIKGMRSFLNSIRDGVNRQLLPALWAANGLPKETMPVLHYENLAPIDLDVLGKFIRSLALAGAKMFPNPEFENAAMAAAGMPERTEDEILELYRKAEADALAAREAVVDPAPVSSEDPQTQSENQRKGMNDDE